MAATRELSASFIWQPIVQIWKCLPFSGSGAGEITGINSIVAPFGTVGLPRCGLETGARRSGGHQNRPRCAAADQFTTSAVLAQVRQNRSNCVFESPSDHLAFASSFMSVRSERAR